MAHLRPWVLCFGLFACGPEEEASFVDSHDDDVRVWVMGDLTWVTHGVQTIATCTEGLALSFSNPECVRPTEAVQPNAGMVLGSFDL